MKPDDQNEHDWLLIVLTIIVGVVIIGFVTYAMFVYLHLSSIGSRLIR